MYQKMNDKCVRRIADGAVIPFDNGNRDYQEYILWCEEGGTPSEPHPELEARSRVVSAVRVGVALIRSGRMVEFQAAANAIDTPPEVKWTFEKATEWSRDSEAFNYLADKVGLTEADKDALFDSSQEGLP